MQTAPRIIIIAGPNGAGKTTFAREFLPNEAACPVFVNAALIAAGIAPFAPETAALQAGRLIFDRRKKRAIALSPFSYNLAARMRPSPVWRKGSSKVDTIFPKTSSGAVLWLDALAL